MPGAVATAAVPQATQEAYAYPRRAAYRRVELRFVSQTPSYPERGHERAITTALSEHAPVNSEEAPGGPRVARHEGAAARGPKPPNKLPRLS